MMTMKFAKQLPRRTRCSLSGVPPLAITLRFHALAALISDSYSSDAVSYKDNDSRFNANKSCSDSGLEDIVLAIKTEATESFSDFSEEIDGHRVHDARDIVTDRNRENSTSFELWRRLQGQGRSALTASDPENSNQIQSLSTSLCNRQEGWRLARFMKRPMAVKAREQKPDAKWYLFIDADPPVLSSSTIRLVEQLDHRQPV